MKRIGCLASPYVRKVPVVLGGGELDYRFELENVWAAEQQSDEWMAHLCDKLSERQSFKDIAPAA